MKDTKKRKKKRSRKPEAEAGTAAESRMKEISEIPEEAGGLQNPEALPEVRDAGLADQDAEPAVRDEVFADQDAGPEADPADGRAQSAAEPEADRETGSGKRTEAAKKSAAKKQVRTGRRFKDHDSFVSGIEEKARARSRLEMEEEEDQRRRQQRISRRAMQRERRARAVRRQKIMAVVVAVLLLILLAVGGQVVRKAWATSTLSEDVLAYRDLVEKYAEEEGIEEYVDILMAIMMVESEGTGEDVMQSSESKGLELNSLEPEESIEQACIYFAALVQMADELGIDDDKALIQAYNFGPGYLTYLSENGKKHRQKLAIEYAKQKSEGKKIRYMHLYAIRKNGGWIYKFGNMFYDALVQRYL